jgi:hypothetical protein
VRVEAPVAPATTETEVPLSVKPGDTTVRDTVYRSVGVGTWRSGSSFSVERLRIGREGGGSSGSPNSVIELRELF